MALFEKQVSLPQDARDHLEKYWSFARRLYDEADFALAAFFAITLLEEVGKVILLGNRDISGTLNQKAFYNHKKKYAFAVGMTLVANSRVSRIYGEEEVRFAKWFRGGDLLKIRNAAIYLELDNGLVGVPAKSVSQEDAFLLICISGEVYGEIQGYFIGTGPDEWERIISEVDQFREKHLSGKSSE